MKYYLYTHTNLGKMSSDAVNLAIVIVYSLLLLKLCTNYSGFDAVKVKEIYKNRELFQPQNNSYNTAKRRIKWLDPVTYYDAVQLNKNDQFTEENISGF